MLGAFASGAAKSFEDILGRGREIEKIEIEHYASDGEYKPLVASTKINNKTPDNQAEKGEAAGTAAAGI